MSKERATQLLLVEDNPGDVRLLREMFNEPGSHNIELMLAESMSEAEKHLAERAVDVVLLDLGLSDAHGLGAVQRAHTAAPRVPLVVLTGLDDESLAVRALRQGAQDYLVKGQIESRGLMRAIRYAIERKRAEEELQQAERELRRTNQLLETTQAMARLGGWELDVVHDILFWTAEIYLIHEISPAEYSPTVATAIGFYAPESRPIMSAAVQDAIERGTPYDLDLELITATGRRISVRATGVPTMERGRTTKITGAFQDITDRKRIEAQLSQSQRLEAIGQLAGGIAHDFNNLLTAIRGYSELAQRGLEQDDPRRSDIDEVIANADRAAALTRQLLAFSRNQALQPQVLDPAAIVESIVPTLRRLLGEHVELASHQAPGLGRITVDPSQLEQVIVNLAVNARDAMPDGGKLTIELSNVEFDPADVASHPGAVPGLYVLLAVSDTGIGMDEETRVRIFEPFFTTKEPGKGTGMGLATVYGIVKQSRGFIYVYSEPLHGTTFRIYLPRVTEERPAAVTENPAARPSSSGTETILLVEDEPAVRGFARHTLEDHGYIVLDAASGADALSIVASHAGPIALLVTDVVMPGLQGPQLAEQLTAARPELRTLYVSGFAENSVTHHGVPDHGVAFLPKPFSAETLSRAVRRVIDGQAV
jgi:signal transduction histidine kinase/DNA-binding response OmpR family regulator